MAENPNESAATALTGMDQSHAIVGLGIPLDVDVDVTGADVSFDDSQGGIVDGATVQAALEDVDAELGSLSDDISEVYSALGKNPHYPPFNVGVSDDEFDDDVFSGWTAVNDTGLVLTETNDVLSIFMDGGDAAAELHAWTKAVSISAGDIIECCISGIQSANGNFHVAGILMSDGHTAGAGKQVGISYSPAEVGWGLYFYDNFTTLTDFTVITAEVENVGANMFLRLKYVSAGNWQAYASPDGITWFSLGTDAFAMTPTEFGFFCSTWGSALPGVATFRYVKRV